MTTNPKQNCSYEDIIHLPHHVSKKHPQMSTHDRAAQFAPFAALTGHEEAVKETARLTDTKIQLDEDEFALLDQKLQYLEAQTKPTTIEITYFVPDERKEGGKYVEMQGNMKRINHHERSLLMQDDTVIPIEDILQITFKAGD